LSAHSIIGGFEEALTDSFSQYAKDIITNTKACKDELERLGAIVSDSDNHLFLLNTLDSYNITGKKAQELLETISVTTNKNMIPNDTLSPKETSGLRIGFAAVTTRGCSKNDAIEIAILIHKFLKGEVSELDAKNKVKLIVSNWQLIEEI